MNTELDDNGDEEWSQTMQQMKDSNPSQRGKSVCRELCRNNVSLAMLVPITENHPSFEWSVTYSPPSPQIYCTGDDALGGRGHDRDDENSNSGASTNSSASNDTSPHEDFVIVNNGIDEKGSKKQQRRFELSTHLEHRMSEYPVSDQAIVKRRLDLLNLVVMQEEEKVVEPCKKETTPKQPDGYLFCASGPSSSSSSSKYRCDHCGTRKGPFKRVPKAAYGANGEHIVVFNLCDACDYEDAHD